MFLGGMLMNDKKQIFDIIQDVLHFFALVLLALFTSRAIFCVDAGLYTGKFFHDLKESFLNAGINEILTFVGAIAFILFGAVGIYEYSYANGIPFLSPPTFKRLKRKNAQKSAEEMMRIYYKNDIEFIRNYEKERIRFLFQSLGIDEKQFHHIKYELVRARTMKTSSENELKEKAKATLLHKEFIVNQETTPINKRVYRDADYFLNLYTAFFDPSVCADAADIMADYITFNMGEKICDIDCLVIPSGSNLLLGLEVGKRLAKPVVAIRREERITKGDFWDGKYDRNKVNKILIIHDFLVTGEKVIGAIEILPARTFIVEGLFCLIQYNRNKNKPEKKLKRYNVTNINCLLEIQEENLKEIYHKE